MTASLFACLYACYPNPYIAVQFKDHGKVFSQRSLNVGMQDQVFVSIIGALRVLNQLKIVRTTWANYTVST